MQKEAQDAHYFREKRAMSGVPFAPEEQMRALAMRVQKAVATEADWLAKLALVSLPSPSRTESNVVRSPRGGVVAWRRVEKTGYTLFKQIDELGAGVMKFVDFYRYLRTQRAPPPRLRLAPPLRAGLIDVRGGLGSAH